MIDFALRIADDITASAIWHGDQCTFVGATLEPRGEQMIVYRSLGGSLYEGTAGIARFLGHAYRHAHDEQFLNVVKGALAYAIAREKGAGLYQGRTGVALTCAELGLLLEDEVLLQQASELAHRVSKETDGSGKTEWDLTVGLAGTVLGLACLGHILEDSVLLSKAETLAAVVAEGATQRAEGLSWADHASLGERDLLCGFAHGTSGIALSFAALGHVTCNDNWWRYADLARSYDNSGYDPENGGWRDLRSDEGERSGRHFWCHGATGVAVDRLWSLASRPEPTLIAEASAAVRGVEHWARDVLDGPHGPGGGFETNLSICHGLFGAADLLLDAAAIGNEPRLKNQAHEIASFGQLTYSATGKWRSGLQGGGSTPSFMLGTAGIGHVYLRLGDGRRTPPAGLPPLVDQVFAAQ